MRRAGVVLVLAAGWVTAGCESGVTIDVTWRVSEAAAGGFDREAPGILVGRFPSQGDDRPLVAVCGDPVEFVEYSDGFGCKPDGVREETLEAWVLPMPATWDPALCDAASIDGAVGADTGGTVSYPIEDLPEPTDADPYGATAAQWRATPICGGALEAEVVVAPR
jgi:hypothetical protein